MLLFIVVNITVWEMAFLQKKQNHYLCHCHSLCKFHHIILTTTNAGHMQLGPHAFCYSLSTAVTVAIHTMQTLLRLLHCHTLKSYIIHLTNHFNANPQASLTITMKQFCLNTTHFGFVVTWHSCGFPMKCHNTFDLAWVKGSVTYFKPRADASLLSHALLVIEHQYVHQYVH